jgi:hypothetical protein
MQDEDIIPFLVRLKRPTLLTRDAHFFERRLVHARYALAWFEVDAGETVFSSDAFSHTRFSGLAHNVLARSYIFDPVAWNIGAKSPNT